MTGPILTEAPPASRAGLRPMQLFRDMAVVPTSLLDPGGIPRGGPLWPDYDQQTVVRHCRNGRPVDRRPDDPGRPPEPLAPPTARRHKAGPQIGRDCAEERERLNQ
jgi:hypothetical protein